MVGRSRLIIATTGLMVAAWTVNSVLGFAFWWAASRAFVGQTVSAMEQQLIIDTLSHCLGNRTHAANILGISIRTLRNKLNEYTAAGVSVPPPQQGAASAA